MKKSFLFRFILLHLVTYWVVGSIMYELCGYEEALDTMEYFSLWRDLQSLPMVFTVFFGQIFRGALLGLLLLPFASMYLQEKRGFLRLFALLFGLTALASPIFLIEALVTEQTFSQLAADLLIGIPELVVQTFLFALLFCSWMNRYLKKVSLK